MAVTVLAPILLSVNTASADHADADGTTATTQADGWSVTPVGSGTNAIVPYAQDRLLFEIVDDGSGATITVKAGTYPPAAEGDLGDLSITLAASDVKHFWFDFGRFSDANGAVTIISSDAGTKLTAYQLARG